MIFQQYGSPKPINNKWMSMISYHDTESIIHVCEQIILHGGIVPS